jgi:hypothetical protein
MLVFATVCLIAATRVSLPGHTFAATGAVIVSDQNDCSVGPTNVNFLAPGQTGYVWLIFNSPTTVDGYTYQITGTSNAFDSGILKIRFNQCRKTNVNDFSARFRTPVVPGGYKLTVFDGTGAKISSDNFTVS